MPEQFPSDYDYHQSIYSEAEKGKRRDKPIVHFHMLASPIVVGYSACVKTVDHPSAECNRAPFVRTSVVKKLHDNGDFETVYSKYVLVA